MYFIFHHYPDYRLPLIEQDSSTQVHFVCWPVTIAKISTQKKKLGLFGNFSQHGGGVFPIPKTQNQKKSAFKSP